MIQIEELRIGNLVKTEYKEIGNIKITEIRESVIYSNKTKGISYSSLLPILLTEEILLKYGFEKSTDIDCYDINKLDNVIIYSIKGLHQVIKYSRNNTNDYHLSISDTNDYCEYGYYVHTSKEIKYLHQLQNLYFALTNQELNYDFNK